ncbi:MAG: glycine betaine/L-proline ABC transporter substrate-binding protein ProX [SAR324 cluster bacterium]|nr:glycine betaine/L-proline ABC transporter substrate-binding protein ProX [SAR324 cluster bacterium]
MKRLILCLITFSFLALPALAYNQYPGKGKTAQPARATWNTGYFQEALIGKALETLGYEVKRVKELQNSLFYKSLTLGDVDYWANGWFPNHYSQVPKDFKEKAGIYGTVVMAGGLQGYLVSKTLVEKYNIKSLDDFKRPEVKKAFDTNGDGKADLVACPPGWGCEGVITHHFEVYDLKDHITPSKAAYAASMAGVLAKFKKGQPVFFYTWAPNWTIFKLLPGRDVMWINVPKIMPKASQESGRAQMTVSGIEGAVTDPIKLGFVVSDIQIVANRKFMDKNPELKSFFAAFTLPLKDINEQNTKMQDGENSAADINKHVDQWIAKNGKTWNYWLELARTAAE